MRDIPCLASTSTGIHCPTLIANEAFRNNKVIVYELLRKPERT